MLISNVTVIDGTGGAPLHGVDVVITNGQFAEISPAAANARDKPGGQRATQVLDGRGGYLVPGLWESHCHQIGFAMAVPEPQRLAHLHQALADYLDAGITSVCDLGGSLLWDRRVRDTAQSGTAATLFYAGPVFTGPGGWPLPMHGDQTMALEVDDVEGARRSVDELVDEVDFVKCIFDSKDDQRMSQATLKAIVDRAHQAGKKVLAHIATGGDVREAVHAGVDCIEHSFIPRNTDDLGEAAQIAAMVAESGTQYCPTIVTWEQLGFSGDRAHLDRLVAEGVITSDDAGQITARPSWGRPFPHHTAGESAVRFDYAMRALPLFYEAGVKLVAGSDIALAMPTPASALVRELQLFAQAGLPCADIIAAATSRAAQKIGVSDVVGTVTIGARADAILLDANPLDDISHLIDPRHHRAVISSGHLVHH